VTAVASPAPLSPKELKAQAKLDAAATKKAAAEAKEQAKREAEAKKKVRPPRHWSNGVPHHRVLQEEAAAKEEAKRLERLSKQSKKSGGDSLVVLPSDMKSMDHPAPAPAAPPSSSGAGPAPPPPPPKAPETVPGPPPGKKGDVRAPPPPQPRGVEPAAKPMAPGAPPPLKAAPESEPSKPSKPLLPEGEVPPPPAGTAPKRRRKDAVALRVKHDYTALNDDELTVRKGDKLFGFELMENNLWWYAEAVVRDRRRGMVPVNFVEAVDPKVKRELASVLAASSDPAVAGMYRAAPAAAGGAAGARPKQGDASKLKLTLYAHNLGYGAALFNLVFGAFSVLWYYQSIQVFDAPLKQSSLQTNVWTWVYALILSGCVYFFEFFFGLKRDRSEAPIISPRGWAYTTCAIPLFFGYPTMLPGGLMLACGMVNLLADWNREEGDASHVKGTYSIMWFESKTAEEKKEQQNAEDDEKLSQTWLQRSRERGTLSQHIVVALYLMINLLIMGVTLAQWENTVYWAFVNQCPPEQCPSYWSPWTKTFGVPLNFNCALILIPVLRSVLRWANNYQLSPTTSLATYLPLRKNIIFHKLIASVVAIQAAMHVTFHFINFAFVPEYTLAVFGVRAWATGAIITVVMVIMYAGAQNRVKRAHYEIFFVSHHFFIIFFIMLLSHGPQFWAYACVPVLLYVAERVYRSRRGNVAFYVRRVLYIPPVMEVCFFPEHDSDFVFREGQYLYLLSPHLSDNEWHPFTISSAHGDLETEKEVTCHIRVQGDKSWTRELMEYFALMTHSKMKAKDAFLLELEHYDSNGERQVGKYLGPDGLPILSVDGPHAAPAQHYSEYKEVMIVGAGIGLTPSSAILKSVCRHKWKKGWLPQTIYFYWVVRHEEIESFRWFIRVMGAPPPPPPLPVCPTPDPNAALACSRAREARRQRQVQRRAGVGQVH